MTGLEIGGWAMAAFAVAGGVNQVLKVVDRVKERPPPAETYATKADCDRRHNCLALEVSAFRVDIQTLRREIKEDFREAAAINEQRASKLHTRVDQLLEAVSEVRGKISL